MRRRTEERQGPMTVPTGDPEALRSAAYRFGTIAAAGHEKPGDQRDPSATIAAVWQGPAADRASAEAATLEQRTRVILDHVAAPMFAMLALATALEAAQRTTRWCLHEQDAADEQYRAHLRGAELSFPDQRPAKLAAAADERDRRMRLARAKYESALTELNLRRSTLANLFAELTTTSLGATDATPHSRLPYDPVGVRIAIAQELAGDLPLTSRELFPPANLRRVVNVYDNPETGLPEWSFQQKLIDAGIKPGSSAIESASWGVGAGVSTAQFATGFAQPALRIGGGALSGSIPRVTSRTASAILKADKVIGKAGAAVGGVGSAVGQLDSDRKYTNMSPVKRGARAFVQGVSSLVGGVAGGAACSWVPVAGPALGPACGMAGTAAGQQAGRWVNSQGWLAPTREDTKRRAAVPLTGSWN